MFKWTKIAVAGVIFFTGTVINADAGIVWYNASGYVVNSNTQSAENFIGICSFEDIDYKDLTDYSPFEYFEYPIRDFYITSETLGIFSGFGGSLSYFSHDTYLQLLGTGFTNELFGDYLELNWDDEIEGWRNTGLRDNYWFPCCELGAANYFLDIKLSRYNHIPEPDVQNFIILGICALFLIPAGMLRTRYRTNITIITCAVSTTPKRS